MADSTIINNPLIHKETNTALPPEGYKNIGRGDEANEEHPGLSPVKIQQKYFENLADCDWVKYEKHSMNYLLQNMAFALFGSPSHEGELSEVIGDDTVRLEGYTSRQKEQVMKVYEKLCEQSKYSQNHEDITMSVLLIVCARPKPVKFYKRTSDRWVDLHQKTDIDMWCSAVFRVRKCIPTIGAKSCKVYIDENARVYHDWESYLANNTQAKCVMIVPKNGEYSGVLIEDQKSFALKLTVVPSPALGVKARVLSTVDRASTVASLGAVGVLGAAMFTPVVPVVLVGATVATVATGLYGLVRSSFHLHDRNMHEQSISPTDSEARGSWLNIAASSVGLAAGAASSLLSKTAAAGTSMTKTGQALAMSVELLRHANIVTGGASVVNSLIMKYRKHAETLTKLELFQFTSATLFFCNAVMSTKTAQSIIEDAQANTINEYRNNLRTNRLRKIFEKLKAESRRVQGTIQGNTEVIRGIKNIGDKNQYFVDVLRINKDINQHKLKISMMADGKVNLNYQHIMCHPSDLCNVGKYGMTELFTKLGPDQLALQNAPTRVAPSTTAVTRLGDREEEQSNMLVEIHPEEILRVGHFLVKISSSRAENISLLLENLSQENYANLMTVSLKLLSELLPKDVAKFKILDPDEDLIVHLVKFVFHFMQRERPLGETFVDTDSGVVFALKQFFQDGRLRQESIMHLRARYLGWLDEELDRRRALYPNKKLIICTICQGVRYAQRNSDRKTPNM